jgi:hypothetical protein
MAAPPWQLRAARPTNHAQAASLPGTVIAEASHNARAEPTLGATKATHVARRLSHVPAEASHDAGTTATCLAAEPARATSAAAGQGVGLHQSRPHKERHNHDRNLAHDVIL